MNKLNFIILMVSFCSVLLFGNETQQKENTSSTWVQSMRVARKSLIDSNKIQELERMDKDILLKMKEKDISDSEKDACRLINYIIISRNYYSTNNIALGLELLYSKFSDKNYFLDTVFDIANYDFMKNHLILSTVLNGFKKCIGTNEDKLFKSYKMIAPNFIHYIYDLSEIGSIPVITSLIQFLNSYFILVEDGKLTGHYNAEAEDTFGKLQSALRGDLKKYKGGVELQKNYNFYVNNRRERGAY